MGYGVFSCECHYELIGVSNHVWKRSRRTLSVAGARVPEDMWVTCFLKLLLSSLRFTVHVAVVVVALEVCEYLCTGYEGQKRGRNKMATEHGFTRTHPIPRMCVCVNNLHQMFLLLFHYGRWCVSTSVLSVGLQSHVMSSGSPALLHKHKSLAAPGGFHPRRNVLSPAVQGEK